MTPPSLAPWRSSPTTLSPPTRTRRRPSASMKVTSSKSFKRTPQVGGGSPHDRSMLTTVGSDEAVVCGLLVLYNTQK